VQAIQQTRRPVAALAINAGVGVGGEFSSGTSLEEELRMIRLNVLSSVHLAKRMLPDMLAQRRGRVLFTASIASLMPAPYEAVYGATKAFLLSFSASLHRELKGSGVTVTAVLPGPTETNFFHRAHMDDTKLGVQTKDSPSEVARQAYEAMMAGKERQVTGSLRTKLMGAIARFLPESAKAKYHSVAARPGSARVSH
jgi:short-subunit dehydrogenase